MQALEILNDPQFIEASRVLAQEIMATPGDPAQWVETIFLSLTSRYPNQDELDNLTSLFTRESEKYQSDVNSALALLSVGEAPVNKELSAPDLAALTVVVNVILNLDEAKMKKYTTAEAMIP